jgi:hypothetical protein
MEFILVNFCVLLPTSLQIYITVQSNITVHTNEIPMAADGDMHEESARRLAERLKFGPDKHDRVLMDV